MKVERESFMKYHIFISKKELLTGVFFIVGFLFLLNGIHSTYKCNHVLNLKELEAHELKEGVCVSGNIDSYIGKHLSGNNKFFGVGQSHLTLFGQSYDFYTIPVGKNSYICILAFSKSLKEQLEAFEDHSGKGHFSPADVLRERNTCHVGKHSLKMIGGTAGNFSKLFVIYLICQMLLHIGNCLIQLFNPFHTVKSSCLIQVYKNLT